MIKRGIIISLCFLHFGLYLDNRIFKAGLLIKDFGFS